MVNPAMAGTRCGGEVVSPGTSSWVPGRALDHRRPRPAGSLGQRASRVAGLIDGRISMGASRRADLRGPVRANGTSRRKVLEVVKPPARQNVEHPGLAMVKGFEGSQLVETRGFKCSPG
jgi:hypothetical protein